MLVTEEELLELMDKFLEYSDFGNWHGNDNDMTRFADALIKLYKERLIQNVLAAE